MKRLKRALGVALGWCSLVFSGEAQTHQITGIQLDSFPQIQVEVWERNPEASGDWQLMEGDQAVGAWEMATLPAPVKQRRKALILFEDSHSSAFDGQRAYLNELIASSLDAFAADDSLYLAGIDWTGTSGKALSAGQIFRGTKRDLEDRLASWSRPPSTGRIHVQMTELNQAIYEGIVFMSELATDEVFDKSVWVFSGEHSNIYNPQHTQESVILAARKNNIPVYCFRYPRVADKYNLEKVAVETFGYSHKLDPSVSPLDEAQKVKEMISGSLERNAGRAFVLRYQTEKSVGGSAVVVKLSRAGQLGSAEGLFRTPGYFEYIMASRKRTAIAVGVGGTCLALMMVLLLLNRRGKKRRAQQRAMEKLVAQEQMQAERMRQQSEIDALRNREEMRDKRAEEERMLEARKRQDEESNARFRGLQRTPLLIDESGRAHPLGMATTIGRSREKCQLFIDHATLSREHAVILFERRNLEALPEANGRFFLCDLGSTNGSFVNHVAVKDAVELKDGDLVKLGGQMFTFRN
jgi:hypothetical protein